MASSAGLLTSRQLKMLPIWLIYVQAKRLKKPRCQLGFNPLVKQQTGCAPMPMGKRFVVGASKTDIWDTISQHFLREVKYCFVINYKEYLWNSSYCKKSTICKAAARQRTSRASLLTSLLQFPKVFVAQMSKNDVSRHMIYHPFNIRGILHFLELNLWPSERPFLLSSCFKFSPTAF